MPIPMSINLNLLILRNINHMTIWHILSVTSIKTWDILAYAMCASAASVLQFRPSHHFTILPFNN